MRVRYHETHTHTHKHTIARNDHTYGKIVTSYYRRDSYLETVRQALGGKK